MQIRVDSSKKVKTDSLILPMFKGEMKLPAYINATDKKLIARLFKQKEFKGDKGELVLDLSAGTTVKLMLLGLGEEKYLKLADVYKAVGAAVLRLKRSKSQSITIWVPKKLSNKFSHDDLGQSLSESALVSGYSYWKYRTKDKNPTAIKEFAVQPEDVNAEKPMQKGSRVGQVIGASVNMARDYGNSPSNEVTPTKLAECAKEIAKQFPAIQLKVLGRKEIEREKMGGLLGVAKGSPEEPKFIVMEYWGATGVKNGGRGSKSGAKNGAKKTVPTYVVIGKGITFDTGGISIKPSEKLEEMKFDMAGGGATLGIMRTVAALKLPINVVGLVPATENMPSGSAYKPGDILTMMDDSTVEVINTDAEGRLVLADALTYAKRYNPELVVDLATLTGACVVALGDLSAGLFTKDEKLVEGLLHSSTHTGDLVWHMPLFDEYAERMKSHVADLRNISSVSGGGAITGAMFLQSFVRGQDGKDAFRWAHLDIAGTAWAPSGNSFMEPGATGAGVRLMVQFLREFCVPKVPKADTKA